MPIKNQFSELFDHIKSWRHHIHQNPELLYDTVKTSKYVETKLKEFGCDKVVTGIGTVSYTHLTLPTKRIV